LLVGVGLGRLQQPGASSAIVAEGPSAAAPVAMLAAYDAVAYEQAVGELQLILEAMRDQLQPGTVAVLEANLEIIDQAITDSRAALAADPANDHLHRHLAANLQTKLQLLRMVTTSVTAQS
jgi:hypothetical protein